MTFKEIPQELRGKTAVPFLEWVKSRDEINNLDKIIDFFSQKFSVDMLCNRAEKMMRDVENIPESCYDCENPEWQQAEDKVLFVDWEHHKHLPIIYLKDTDIYYNYEGNYLTIDNKPRKIISLNDFVNEFHKENISLTFKN